MRYTRRQQWHVTLKFLGAADVDEATAGIGSLRAPTATAQLGPTVGRLGRHVLVLPVEGLDDLAAAVLAVTDRIGEPVTGRPFRGHLTLARLSRRDTGGLVGQHLATGFEVSVVHLVESRLASTGAQYRTLATVPLS